jgi:ABC-type uncharacterized transport system involved in gliding motility auxiliary subunit
MTSHIHTGKKKAYDATSLAVLGMLFIALIVVSTLLFRGWRIDLTENNLYTIAPGTKRVLANLEEPINLYFFFSQEPSRDVPAIRAYAQRVRELLEEMAQRSDGKVRLSVIDPQPFSDDEDRAGQFGLQSAPIGARGEQLYFGLAGTNSTDGKQVIGFFQPDKEEFLEYDIASLIYKLANPKRPTVGLISSLPMEASFDQRSGQMREGWAVLAHLREMYAVQSLQPDVQSIDKDIDVLLVVHPKNVSPSLSYAIDQFVMRGGKLMAFVDPLAEQDASRNPMAGGDGNRSSTLSPLFAAWGIEYDATKVIGDAELALTVSTRPGQPPVRHLAVLALSREQLDSKDVTTSTLNNINMWSVGALKHSANATTKFEPLMTSSNQAALLSAEKLSLLSDPQTLLDDFAPSGETYTIAARVSGKLTSAFPNGAPSDTGEAQNPLLAAMNQGEHLKESAGDANVIVVADSDLLADMMWLRQQNLFGQRYAVAWANNGDFVANALDNLAGSSDLISVRGRQSFFRPFTRVDDLRQRADRQLRVKEQELNRELQETDQKLQQLQAGRADQGSFTLTPEQEAEINRFQQERARVRKELRDVRRSLDVGINRMGTVLKIINIGLIPVILIVIAIVIAIRRRQRLKTSRHDSSPIGASA